MSGDSEEKIIKFLQSEDPALRKMGLSLTTGVGLPDSCNADLFAISFFDPEPSNRTTASVITSESFPEIFGELKKRWDNYQPNTRNESKKFDPYQMGYDFEVESFMQDFHKLSAESGLDVCKVSLRGYNLLKGGVEQISDSYKDLVGGFVKFLGTEKYQPAKQMMIDIYKQFGDDGPGREVILIIHNFEGEDIVELLVEGLLNKKYFISNSIDDTAKQLVKIGSENIAAKLAEALSDRGGARILYGGVPLTRDVLWCLGKLGHCCALEPLANFCRSNLINLGMDGWESLSASAYALAELSHCDEDSSLELLLEMVDHRSEWVVETAVYALGMIGSERSIPKIEDIIAGKRGKGHSRAFGWGNYMPFTEKTAKAALNAIRSNDKLPPVKTPWPLNHDWSRSEMNY